MSANAGRLDTVYDTNDETITDDESSDDEPESECNEDDDDAALEEAPGKVTALDGTTMSEEEANKQPTDLAAAKKFLLETDVFDTLTNEEKLKKQIEANKYNELREYTEELYSEANDEDFEDSEVITFATEGTAYIEWEQPQGDSCYQRMLKDVRVFQRNLGLLISSSLLPNSEDMDLANTSLSLAAQLLCRETEDTRQMLITKVSEFETAQRETQNKLSKEIDGATMLLRSSNDLETDISKVNEVCKHATSSAGLRMQVEALDEAIQDADKVYDEMFTTRPFDTYEILLENMTHLMQAAQEAFNDLRLPPAQPGEEQYEETMKLLAESRELAWDILEGGQIDPRKYTSITSALPEDRAAALATMSPRDMEKALATFGFNAMKERLLSRFDISTRSDYKLCTLSADYDNLDKAKTWMLNTSFLDLYGDVFPLLAVLGAATVLKNEDGHFIGFVAEQRDEITGTPSLLKDDKLRRYRDYLSTWLKGIPGKKGKPTAKKLPIEESAPSERLTETLQLSVQKIKHRSSPSYKFKVALDNLVLSIPEEMRSQLSNSLTQVAQTAAGLTPEASEMWDNYAFQFLADNEEHPSHEVEGKGDESAAERELPDGEPAPKKPTESKKRPRDEEGTDNEEPPAAAAQWADALAEDFLEELRAAAAAAKKAKLEPPSI